MTMFFVAVAFMFFMPPVPIVSVAVIAMPLVVFRVVWIFTIPLFVAVADRVLVVSSPVLCVLRSVPVMMHPWLLLIHHHLMCAVKIKTIVAGW